MSVLQGHTHPFGAHARTTVDGHVILGIENFCMCSRRASYVAYPNWQGVLGRVPRAQVGAVSVVSGDDRAEWVCVEWEIVFIVRGPKQTSSFRRDRKMTWYRNR